MTTAGAIQPSEEMTDMLVILHCSLLSAERVETLLNFQAQTPDSKDMGHSPKEADDSSVTAVLELCVAGSLLSIPSFHKTGCHRRPEDFILVWAIPLKNTFYFSLLCSIICFWIGQRFNQDSPGENEASFFT